MWIVYSLISAVSDASKNVMAKKGTGNFNTTIVTWAWLFYSLIILVPLAFFKGGIPSLDLVFWKVFFIRIVIETLALVLYVKSIKITDLSLSLPMLSLSPFFLILTGLVINHELPKPLGLIGVVAVVIGAYFLNFKLGKGVFEPFISIFRDRGVLMMFGVAFLWSITSSLHKVAIEHSNAYFYAGFSALVLTVIFTLPAYFSNKKEFLLALKPGNILKIGTIGVLDGIAVLSQMLGQSLMTTVLVISVKRLSTVFSSVLGWLLFKEPIKNRIIPICIMVLGVVLISIS